jgi:hypothetical protein
VRATQAAAHRGRQILALALSEHGIDVLLPRRTGQVVGFHGVDHGSEAVPCNGTGGAQIGGIVCERDNFTLF